MAKKRKAKALSVDVDADPEVHFDASTKLPKVQSLTLYPHRQFGNVVPENYDPGAQLGIKKDEEVGYDHALGRMAELRKTLHEDDLLRTSMYEVNKLWVARAHYTRMYIKRPREEMLEVDLGDSVEISGPDDSTFLVKITEMFEDVDDKTEDPGKMFNCHYYYKPLETVLACDLHNLAANDEKRIMVPQDMRRIFIATFNDNASYSTVHHGASILRKVQVVRVKPGEKPPDAEHVNTWWYEQTHCKKFFTFKDIEPEQPLAGLETFNWRREEGALSLALKYGRLLEAPFTKKFVSNERKKNPNLKPAPPKVLRMLELCAGAGGLSGLAQKGVVNGQDVEIIDQWACDFDKHACVTYATNHCRTIVVATGIDELYWLLRLWKEVADTWGIWEPPAGRECVFVTGGIQDVRLRDHAKRGLVKQDKGQLVAPLERDDVWLEFLVTHPNPQVHKDGSRPSAWITMKALLDIPGAEVDFAHFVKKAIAADAIPLPGRVGIVAGGPPCQGVSGLNRHARTEDIMTSAKNRLAYTYFKIIKFLQPDYTLTEQVLDVFKKEEGRYARFIAAALTGLRYQCRFGVIAAGDHGCPQGRYRCIVWGARAGLVLPSFPEPSHNVEDFHTPIPSSAKECHVTFLSEERKAKALPKTLLEDVLSDLPEVDNFEMSEVCEYASAPKRPYQLYLRRKAPSGSLSCEQRIDSALNYHTANIDAWLAELQGHARQSPVVLGAEFYNSKNNYLLSKAAAPLPLGLPASPEDLDVRAWLLRHGAYATASVKTAKQLATLEARIAAGLDADSGNFAAEVWKSGLLVVAANALEAQQMELERMSTAYAYAHEIGVRVCSYMAKAAEQEKQREADKAAKRETACLQAHRPLICNADDQYRMASIPRDQKGRNFRDMPGVISHLDGTSCAGHTHSYQRPDAQGVMHTHCPGGGTLAAPARSNTKESRVDQHDKDGWRGWSLHNCDAETAWMPTGDLVCPRWCITYKNGKSGERGGRHGCFGRCWWDEIQTTVVTRAEPHNLAIVHPTQDRVLTIREMARCQGFPDYYIFTGDGQAPESRGDSSHIHTRYKQIGNAVAPPVAIALGRCLLLAMSGIQPPVDVPVVPVPDPDLLMAYKEAEDLGLQAYSVELEERRRQGLEPPAPAKQPRSGRFSAAIAMKLEAGEVEDGGEEEEEIEDAEGEEEEESVEDEGDD